MSPRSHVHMLKPTPTATMLPSSGLRRHDLEALKDRLVMHLRMVVHMPIRAGFLTSNCALDPAIAGKATSEATVRRARCSE